jgi:endoglucanase
MKKRSIGNWSGRVATIGLAFAAAHCSSSTDDGVSVPAYQGPGATPGTGAPNGSGVATGPGTSAGTGTPGANGQPSGVNEGTPNVGGVDPGMQPTGGTSTGANGTGGVPGTPVDPTQLGQPSGTGPVATDLSCDGINIAAADVISDFSTEQPVMYAVGNHGGTTWRSYAPSPADPSNPSVGNNAFVIDPTQSGPCNSGGALHVSSPGTTGFGVGISVNFKQDVTPGVSEVYDAKADGYTGVGFWALCQQEVEFTLLKFSDDATDATVQNPKCSDSGGGLPGCRQYGVKNAALMSDQWTHYEMYFDEMLLDASATTAGTGLNANALTAFQIQVNSKAQSQPNGFDCLVDDVHFLRNPTPRPAPAANITSVAGHTVAPGGYYTQGNQIFDSAGQVHRFKGLARPTFEFDASGQGFSREDVKRMHATGANVIRYAVSEGFWLSTHPAFNPNYQAYIDRAVQWTLEAGMDVIIDLHWSGNPPNQQATPDRDSITFWQQVAQKYKNDGRVIFELYNEPHPTSTTIWRNGDGGDATGMQQLYDAVRGTGANNLVLVGGMDFAYNLTDVLPAMQLTGTNIAYVTHPYKFKSPPPPAGYEPVTATFPVVATEFGDADISGIGPNDCGTAPYTSALSDFNRLGVSYTAWAWVADAKRCAFPSLIERYDGTPTGPGQVVFDDLKR